MAVSVEAAFVLLDKASGPLKDIQRQAVLTDKALNSMGGATGGTSKLQSFTNDLEAARGGMKDMTGEAGRAAREVRNLGRDVDKTGNFFSRRLRDMKNWIGGTSTLASVTKGATGAVAGLAGALKGAATAFPLLITGAVLAAPAVLSLVGALGGLVSSLTFAVGGGAILGGGLLGAFGVGLASLVAVGKPALTSLKSYQAAVKSLNTAEQSGSATAVKAAQARLDAINKQNPGVKKLADNLTGLQGAWKKATAPARQELFGTANDAIKTLRKQMSWLGPEANKNVGAISDAFKKYIIPVFNSKAFKDFVTTLGEIFRKNLPGFAKGIVSIFKGLVNILKDVAPHLQKVGGGFAKMGDNFDKWTKSSKGKKSIDDMIDSFKQWMRLIKGVVRILGDLLGAGQKSGTKEIKGWADSVNKIADRLGKKGGTKGIQDYFDQSMRKTNQLWPVLQNVATSLADIYKVFKPLGSATQYILQNFPAPAVAALAVAVLGGKMVKGAFSSAKGMSKFFAKFANRGGGAGGIASTFLEQGGSFRKPLFVFVVNEGFTGVHKNKGEVLTEGGLQSEAKAVEKPGLFARAKTKVASKIPEPIKKANAAYDRGVRKVLTKAGTTALGTKAVAAGGAAAEALKGTPLLAKAAKALKLPLSVAGKLPLVDLFAAAFGFIDSSEGGSVLQRSASAAEMLDPTSYLGLLPIPGIQGFQGVAHALLHPLVQPGLPFSKTYPKLKQEFGEGGPGGPSIYGTGAAPGLGAAPAAIQASDDKFNSFIKKIDSVRTHLATLAPTQIQKLLDWAGKLADDPNLQKYQGYIDNVSAALKDPTTGLMGAIKKVTPQFVTMANTAGTNLANIVSNTQTTVQNIADQLGTKSAAATQALATNYAIAADAVKVSMQDGVIKNTKAGIAEVQSLMTKAFRELGIPPGIAKKLASQGWSLKAVSSGQASIKASGIGPNQPYATGGRLPGAPSGDHLPLLGRGGSVLGIADGGELVVNRHTEGRINAKLAAYGTTLGKEVAGETQPHFANGGRIPRYATGGVVGEVNQYFSARGWDKAAIAGILGNAMQESTMNPNTPGGGLWQQISNFGSSSGGSLQNQMNRMYPQIVGLRSAMNRSSPAGAATIFESQFEKAGIPAMANRIRYAQEAYAGKLGAGLTGGSITPVSLSAPTIGGFGFQQALGQGAANAYTSAANWVLRRASMAAGGGAGGGFGGGVSTAGVTGAGGLGTFDGLQVANWIIPILNWARQHGWGGRITSGYRPGSITTSGNVSNHSKTSYPGGAVDVGDPNAIAQGEALWNVVRNYPRSPKLYSAAFGPGAWTGYTDSAGQYHVHDYGHFSATGHALGGRLPWFGAGADFIARRPQLIGVGDGPGAERVTVTPQNQNPTTTRPVTINIGRIEVNRKGDVQKIVDEELQLLADSIGRQL